MGPGAPGRDQLVSDVPGEWKVGDAVAVQVPELATPEPELDSPKAMRSRRNARPGRNHDSDPLARTTPVDRHLSRG